MDSDENCEETSLSSGFGSLPAASLATYTVKFLAISLSKAGDCDSKNLANFERIEQTK